DLFLLEQRGRVMGFIQMAFATSQILGIPLGLYFANNWGWHSSFLMIVILAIAILALIIIKLEPVNKHLEIKSDKNPFIHLLHTLSHKRYQTGFTAIAILSVGGFMLPPFGTAYLVTNIKVSHEELLIIFFFTGLAVLFIMPMVGKLSDRMSKLKLFTIGSLISIVMILIYTNLPPIPVWQIIVINMILFMGIMSRMVPATTLNTAVPETQDRGAYMAITSSLQQIAGGIAAVCAGNIVHQETKTSPLINYDVLGYVISIITLLSILLILRVDILINPKTETPVPAPVKA